MCKIILSHIVYHVKKLKVFAAYAAPAELCNAPLYFGNLLILSVSIRLRNSMRGENHRGIGSV